MQRVTSSGGATIAVHDLGGAADAPTLLLAHANGFHAHVFGPMVDAGLAQRFHCVAFDFRGHGESTMNGLPVDDWWAFGDDVAAVLAALPDQRPLFGFGHSMGGAALLMAELNAPGTFTSLFLFEPITPPGAAWTSMDMATGDNPMADVAERRREKFDSGEAAIANFSSKPPLNMFTPEAMRAYVEHGFAPQSDGSVRLRCRGATEASIYRTSGTHHVFDRLGDVDCPVTVAAGSVAIPGPASFAALAAQQLRHGRYLQLDSLDHFGPMAAPDQLAAVASAALLPGD